MSFPVLIIVGLVLNAAAALLVLWRGSLDPGGAAAGVVIGTVYFPISLLVLVNLCWRGVMPVWVGGMAVLVLGWGDGLAALVGEGNGAQGVRIWGGRKSAAGTILMFSASFVVTLAFTLIFNTRYGSFLPAIEVSTIVAAAATAVELFTPLGIDNLTVPLAVAALYAGVFA